ncbi:glycosyltransferase BC10-like [Andrographis paniculata]|uniref:glycosyltransferase BC10-like n=1 Tax=Andrographis paniculata TaxID=175694 RepID=UPI0021E7B637|nr:glycosyltransferase BC10-like [Andrographis paniculata]
MRKKASASAKPGLSMRRALGLGWKSVILVSVLLGGLALLRVQQYSQATVYPYTVPLPRKSWVLSHQFSGNPKIAFLFLVRRNLPLDFVWESFFENVDKANYSVYVHSEPGFLFDESTTKSALFVNRQLKNSIKVAWGEASMIQAERLLFDEALRDPANQRFVLLSDSCVPLYNFSYIYNYLMVSPRSFVDSFLDKKDVRYNPKMSPTIPQKKWRKGSQWVALIRRHAEVVVDDEIVFPIFQNFCKRRPPADPSKGRKNLKLQKQHNCIPDEHYVQTLLAMSDLESELERRTLTYTLWNQSTGNPENDAWHPFTFSYASSGPQDIKKIRGINHVYYDTEFRTEWCSNNNQSVPCFLFARKFSQGAGMRLLSLGIVGNSEISTLMDTQT